jgi:hypothetical protein
MFRTSGLAKSRARRPRRKAASPLRLDVLEDRNLLSFSSITSYAAGAYPNAVALGDFNNDTRLDLAVVNYGGNSVSVLLAKPDGTFGPAVNASTGAYPLSLAVGDFSGDGKLDIATANLGQNGYDADISILLGNGDGTMQAARSVGLPGDQFGDPQQPVSVAVGDFNADGKLDLTATGDTVYELPGYGSTFYDYANILLGNGDGSFTWSEAKFLHFGYFPFSSSVAVADFNGDAKPDLAVEDSSAGTSGSATILLGNGDGTFGPAVNAGAGATSLAVGDFNSDGQLDIATPSSILLGNGDGTLQTATTYDLGSTPLSVAAGDINADGKLDLVATSYSGDASSGFTSYVKVLLGYGNGTLAAPQATTLPFGRPFGVALGKLNGDGWIDVATANVDTSDATVLINGGGWVLPPPSLSISDVTVSEGNTGTVNAVFTVSLSAPWNQTVTVHYSTADSTATTAGNDYQAKSGTLTFAPGVTSQTVTVVVNGDRLAEADESFFVNLDSPTVAPIADGQGVGTILDDEPRLTIGDVSLNEGNKGTTSFNFTVSLSAAYDAAVTVSYATADGTATVANMDYQARSGTVTFAAGVTSQTVTILVNGDRTKEPDETFSVNLSNAVKALLTDGQGVGTILNDERGGQGQAPTAAAPSAPGVADMSVALSAGATRPSAALPPSDAAPPRLARQPLSTAAVGHGFAGVVGEARPILPANAKGQAPALDPLAARPADNGLSWNENVLGGIVP